MIRLTLITLLFFPISLFAENNSKISGIVSNATVDAIELQTDNLYIGNRTTKQYVQVRDGKFEHETALTGPALIRLVIHDISIPVFMEPGNDLNLSIDVRQGVTSAKFAGNGAANNNFLTGFHEKFGKDFNSIIMKPKLIVSSIDELEMLLFDNKKAQLGFMKSFPAGKELSEGFRSFIKNKVEFNYWRFLYAAPLAKAEVNKSLNISAIPKLMSKDFNPKNLKRPGAMLTESYREFIAVYLKYQAIASNEYVKFEDLTKETDQIYNVATAQLTGLPLIYSLSRHLYENCSLIQPEAIRKLYKAITELDEKGQYAALCKQKCGQRLNARQPRKAAKENKAAPTTKNKTESGGSADKFTMLGEDGKDFSLDDLKGKVVYIDFWASWCGPCRQQFPFAKKLKDKLTKKQLKQVEFLYISIDRDTKSWKNAIAKYQLEGKHGFSSGGWGSKACKYFNISSIPRYMLMDKKGNIVNKNAPRPSQEQTLEQILKLLEG